MATILGRIDGKQIVAMAERMWPCVEGCMIWVGPVNRDGYAVMTIGHGRERRRVTVHRVILTLKFNVELPPRIVTRHTCHNRDCVHPEHLTWGSAADNVGDTVRAGRHAFGERHGNAVLTEEAVVEIRSLWASRSMTVREMAARYGTSRSAIRAVVTGRTWRHVAFPAQGSGSRAYLQNDNDQ